MYLERDKSLLVLLIPKGVVCSPLMVHLILRVCGLLWPSWLTFGPLPYFMLHLLPFNLIIKPLTFILWFYIMTFGPFIVLALHLKYFMTIFYLSYLPYIRLMFSSFVSSSSEVSFLVHECFSLVFSFIFPHLTIANNESSFGFTGLPIYSTVTVSS